MTTELRTRLERAIRCPGRPSSDYDLNTDQVFSGNGKLRQAGVLVPIMTSAPEPTVVLTVRSSALKHHPGQIAFPGGKVEDVDRDAVEAALREAKEEVGLDSSIADVVGLLPPHETVTGFTVTPVIALVDSSFRPMPEQGEVAEVFHVPLSHLMRPSSYTVESRYWRESRRAYYTVPWGPYYIWGATARILRSLADRMSDGQH